MTELLPVLLKFSVLIFMAGNLLDMGLRLNVKDALDGFQRKRFMALTVLWGFVLLPALAWGIGQSLPLSPEHKIGLMLLGMAPCAPFLAPMVDRARGNLNLAAGVLLVTALTTIGYMVVMVPLLTTGLQATAWAIAQPLVLFMLLPLAVGIVIRIRWPKAAERIHPVLKLIITADTLLLLVLCLVIYGKEFLGLVGSHVPLAQLIFFALAAIGPVLLPMGLLPEERVVVSLAMVTRNLGAALAPLFAASVVPQQAVLTVALGLFMQTTAALIVASLFRRFGKSAQAAGVE